MPLPPTLRRSTEDMFNQQRWVLLIRDNALEDWRCFGNKISGRPYIYGDLDKAIYALKHIQSSRYKMGNAKLIKAEDYGIPPIKDHKYIPLEEDHAGRHS